MYFDAESKNCQLCKSNHCKKCAPDGKCEECMGDGEYQFEDGECYTASSSLPSCLKVSKSNPASCALCAQGTYLSPIGLCFPCGVKQCSVCSADGKGCTRCKTGFSYDTKNKTCDKCPDDCSDCMTDDDGDIICLKCMEKGHWFDKTAGKCATCLLDPSAKGPGPCIDCNTQTQTCEKCGPGLRLTDKNLCVACPKVCSSCNSDSSCSMCAPGYWFEDKKCVTCEAGCLDCDFIAKKCKTCADLFFLDPISQKCENCPEHCFKCDSDGKCLECGYNSYFVAATGGCKKTNSDFCAEYDLTNGKCLNCFGDSYFDEATSNCIAFPPGCAQLDKNLECKACRGKAYFNPETKECEDCLIEDCL